MNELSGRVAVVTGAGKNIGRAIALALADGGAKVAVNGRSDRGSVDAVVAEIAAKGGEALPVMADVSDEAAVGRLIDAVADRFGRIDILVNNAAYQGKSVKKFEELDAERVEKTFRVNIIAMFHLVRHALPHMKKGAVIVNTASVQAYHPSPGILDYATTKGAIVTFTKGLAQSLIERGIRVNCVAPGPVWTPLVVQSFDAKKNEKFGENYPMERPAQPAELAPSYVFLASDESRYVNGEVLGVTGGKPLG